MMLRSLLALSLAVSAACAAPELYPTDYFRSQQFRDAFLASLGVKSDVEPPLTEQEQDYLRQLQPHLERQEEINDCIETLAKLVTPDSTARFDYELGMLYFRKGDMPAAEKSLQQAVTRFPRFLRAHQNLGMVFTRSGKFSKAVEHLTQAVALGQADEQLYGLLGYAYMQANQPLSAETAYRNAIMLGPKSLDWKMGLAQALFKQSKAAEAVTLLGELLKEHPEKVELWNLQAAAHLANKSPLDAAKNYELLSMMQKASAENLGTLGDIYLNEGIYPLATSAYLRALRAPQAKPEAAVRATELLAQRGANEAVREMVSGIQEAQPALESTLSQADEDSGSGRNSRGVTR
jgi:tetratricopeptide (TPR) repeat protein